MVKSKMMKLNAYILRRDWNGGVSNSLSLIVQITYLLFIKRLDDLKILEERKLEALGTRFPSTEVKALVTIFDEIRDGAVA